MSTEPKFKKDDIVVGSYGYERKILCVGTRSYFYVVLSSGDEWEKPIHEADKEWSLKPREVTITREKLDEACGKASKRVNAMDTYFERLCEELGL